MKLPRWVRVVLLGILALFLALVLALAVLWAISNWASKRYPSFYYSSLPCHSRVKVPLRTLGSFVDTYKEDFLAWTPDGSRVLFSYGKKDIYIADADGTQLRNLVTVSSFDNAKYGRHADVSPDGTQIVYSSCEFPTGTEYEVAEQENYHYEIALMNLDGTGKRRLTENRDMDHYPVWSPDGKRIAFISTLHRKSANVNYYPTAAELYTMAADGSDVQRMAPPEHRGAALLPPVWSPDGKYLAYLELALRERGEVRDPQKTALYTVRVDGMQQTAIALTTLVPPAWSPDGQYLAFVRSGEESGVYTVRPDGTDMQKVMGLTRPAIHVSWSPDGSALLVISDELELFVMQPDGKGAHKVSLGFVPYHNGQTLVAFSPDGTRIALFDGYSRLATMNLDGTDRRDLIHMEDDGTLVPANPPQDE